MVRMTFRFEDGLHESAVKKAQEQNLSLTQYLNNLIKKDTEEPGIQSIRIYFTNSSLEPIEVNFEYI